MLRGAPATRRFSIVETGPAHLRQNDALPLVRRPTSNVGDVDMNTNRKTFRISLDARDLDEFRDACETVQWQAIDTGERVMTDEGPDAEAILIVAPVERIRPTKAAAMLH